MRSIVGLAAVMRLVEWWRTPVVWEADSGGYVVALLRGDRPPVYSTLVDWASEGVWPTAAEYAIIGLIQGAAWIGLVAVVARRAPWTALGLALLSGDATWERAVSPLCLAAALVGIGAEVIDTHPRVAGVLLALAALTRVELLIVPIVAAAFILTRRRQ